MRRFYKKVLGNNRSLGIMAHVYAVHFLDRKPITLRTLDRSKAEPATEMSVGIVTASCALPPLPPPPPLAATARNRQAHIAPVPWPCC